MTLRHHVVSLTLFAVALALAGCVGKDYVRPEIAIPEQFHNEMPRDTGADPTKVWARFNDSALTRILARSESSLQVREALARLDEATGLRRQATGEYGPQLTAAGSVTRERTTANGANPNGGKTQNTFRGGFDLAWEIDLVGGLTRTREASDAFLSENQEKVRAVRLLWQAEVADAYLAWRHALVRAAAIRSGAAAVANSAQIARSRANLGVVDEATAARVEAQAAAQNAIVPQADALPRRQLERLALLLAVNAQDLAKELGTALPPALPAALPPGLPSDLLRRRPDVRAAERNLAYTTARIGVAESDLWPKFFLTGSAGLESLELDDLVSSDSRYWSIGPSLSWSIFSWGRIQAGVDIAEARERQSLVAYERTVRTALFETESALIDIQAATATARAAKTALDAATVARDLAITRSDGGFGWDARLDAERAWADAVTSHADAAAALARAHVAFIKAIGGGFQEVP